VDRRIQLSIISGFLGSGKTTFLQHKIFKKDHSSICIVINEAGDISIDDVLLDDKIEKIKISGGCICCDSNAEFVEKLIDLCGIRNHANADFNNRIDTILVETSGISDPAAIYDSIVNHSILGRNIVVKGISVLLDAFDSNTFISEPLIAKQLACADDIYITKTDLVSNEVVAQKYNIARYFNPSALIRSCSKGEIQNLTEEQTRQFGIKSILPDAKTTRVNSYETFIVNLEENTDWNNLVIWVSALLSCHGDKILRLKGIINSPAGRLLVQGVGPNIQKPQRLPKEFYESKNFLVLIGRGFDKTDIKRSANFLNT
tara:strand:- start:1272 stop:2219 length:948 start_codon:yes stop_codon:yes gene_type:complete